MNLSFAGCGFLGIYHVGVASCIREYAPQLCKGRIAGASAGAIAAACLINDLDLGDCTNYVLRIATQARKRALGPLHPSFNISQIVYEGLHEILPDNAHKVCSGRVFVSLTRVVDRKNVLVSEFETKEDLIQALICSAHVPFYSGIIPPAFRGVRYFDGGLTDNIPSIDENTVTVSPFAGESDICPDDRSSSFMHVSLANTSIQCTARNLYRMARVLFPPHPEVLSEMCRQGFDDALRFLQKHNLITCVKHLSIVSSIQSPPGQTADYDTDDARRRMLTLTEELGDVEDAAALAAAAASAVDDAATVVSADSAVYDLDSTVCDSGIGCTSCRECHYRKQLAGVDSLPAPVLQALQAACANNTILNHVYNTFVFKAVALAFSPWILPLDIMYNIVTRFVRYLPHVPGDGRWLVTEAPNIVRAILQYLFSLRNRRYSAKFRCRMNIREFQMSSALTDAGRRASLRNLNLDFAVQFQSVRHSPVECMQDLEHQVVDDHIGRDLEMKARMDEGHDVTCQPEQPIDDMVDTFDTYLEQVEHMETIMAFYYKDENNVVNVTEIRGSRSVAAAPVSCARPARLSRSRSLSLPRSGASPLCATVGVYGSVTEALDAIDSELTELTWDDYQLMQDERMNLRDLEELNALL